MLEPFRKCLCLALTGLLAALPAAQAQNATTLSAAPVPPQLASAHAIFISNGGGSNYFDSFTGGPDRAYNMLYADLQKEGRYQIVGSPAQADLILEIRAVAPAVGDVDNVGYNPQLILSIHDPRTSAVLWTTHSNVVAFGRQKNRDRQFDDCVAVLVDKFAQAIGQPLSSQQLASIQSNTHPRMPSGMKIFIIAATLGAATFAGWGIYRGTHPPSLQPPTLPQSTPPLLVH